ncbi:MAG: RluA family pseudouridine synthase [Patescibacteria group bacterium]|nr:RluA family pseudouridine synthase [Patescibacteria group bacterium]
MSNLEISRAQRLDQYVAERLPLLSRAFAAKLINDGLVTVNGKVNTKPGTKMRGGEVVVIDYDEHKLAVIPDITLPIVYEDDDCVAVIKPAGLLTHSKGVFNPEATVATWLRTRLNIPDMGQHLDADGADVSATAHNQRVGIVHRLDRATSGIMICAKNSEALSWLQKQFGQRKVKKTYVAIVKGVLKQPHAMIDMAIERNPKHPQTFRVGVNGKSAQTEYKVLSTNERFSLVELKPTTGRTHQLRVHLHEIGHPIVGDTLYDGLKADRLFLHALSLEITLPNRQRQTFDAPLPADFMEFMEQA